MERFLVSVLIVVRNDVVYIIKALDSLLNQKFASDQYEIIIVDGGSTDGTIDIISQYIDKYPNRIKLLDNPKKTLAPGWNIGINNAKGNVIVRIDSHSYVPDDFLQKNVETLKAINDAACVGGPIISIGDNFLSKAIAVVLSCPFGIGNSKFRYSKKAEYVDTVAYGAYRKEVFSEVGLFDESLNRNQDLDMHSRIRKKGWKFYLTPDIYSYYIVRSSLRKFVNQAFENGFWVIHNLIRDKKSVSIRHLIPLAFSVNLICLIAGAFLSRWLLFLLFTMLGIYSILNLFFTFYCSSKDRSTIIILPLLFLILHLSYGIGSIYAIVKLVFKK